MRLGMGLGLGNLLSGGPITGMSNKYSFNLDGSNDYIDFGDIALTGDLTVSAWVKFDDLSVSSNVILGDSANRDWIRVSSATTLDFKVDNTGMSTLTHGLTFTQDEWQLFTLVMSCNTVTIYRNGIAGGTTGTQSGTFTPEYIARKGTNYFDGNIDEVAVWNVALSA